MSISMSQIKELREKTKAGVMDAKKALEESNGDMKKAEAWIRQKGMQRAESKADRATEEGVVVAYVHHNNRAGALVKLNCETDFVAMNTEMTNLGREIGMQVVSMQPKTVDELLKQEYVRDPSLTVAQLIKNTAGKLGENVQLKEFNLLVL